MHIRKVAASKIYTSEKNHLKNFVVELEDGYVSKFYPLTTEQAFTEWFTGTILLTNKNIPSQKGLTNIKDFYFKHPTTSTNDLCCWHLSNVDHMTGDIIKPSIIEQLK